jgi:hypothetical protein
MEILHTKERKVYSQNGEDGIIEYLVKLIYNTPENKKYLEIGTGDGSECNTRYLREKYNWSGVLIDSDYENLNINLHSHFLNKENIITILEKYKLSKINLLSIDIDSTDFYLLDEILKNYKSDIIICEYNAGLYLDDKIVIYNDNFKWDGTNYFGASLLSYTKLLNKYDYSLIYTESMGANAFFINNEIIKKLNLNFLNVNNVDLLYKNGKYGRGPYGGHKKDIKNRNFINFENIKL